MSLGEDMIGCRGDSATASFDIPRRIDPHQCQFGRRLSEFIN
jgi:hypothetical protein